MDSLAHQALPAARRFDRLLKQHKPDENISFLIMDRRRATCNQRTLKGAIYKGEIEKNKHNRTIKIESAKNRLCTCFDQRTL
jgi:hypothetical protein